MSIRLPDDSLDTIITDVDQLDTEVAQSEFRPSAEDICARLKLIATRLRFISARLTDIQEEERATVHPERLDGATAEDVRAGEPRRDLDGGSTGKGASVEGGTPAGASRKARRRTSKNLTHAPHAD